MLRRLVLLVSILFLLSGCASVKDFLSKTESWLSGATNSDNGPQMSYEDIMETRNIRARSSNSGGYASAASADGYRYVPPVVQKVKMPAIVRNGVLIPTHEEYVIINDATYVANDGRAAAIRTKYQIPEDVEVVSPLKGKDAVVAVFRMTPIFEQSTVVPISKAAFLFDGKAMDRVFALANDEIQQVGRVLCSFNRGKGDDWITISLAENGLKGVKTYSVSRNQMLFLPSGYVLVPLFEPSNHRSES